MMETRKSFEAELLQQLIRQGRRCLAQSTAFSLMPPSSKVVVFDRSLKMKYAFRGLVEHDIKSAVVWDNEKQDYAGMLTVTDFVDVLVYYARQAQNEQAVLAPSQSTSSATRRRQTVSHSHTRSDNAAIDTEPSDIEEARGAEEIKSSDSVAAGRRSRPRLEQLSAAAAAAAAAAIPVSLEEQRISEWSDIKEKQGRSMRNLLCIAPSDSVLHGVRLLHQHHIHRLPVVSCEDSSVLCLLSHHRVLWMLMNRLSDFQELLELPLHALEMGTTADDLIQAPPAARVVDVLGLLADHRIPTVPIVDETGKLLNAFTRSDVRNMAVSRQYLQLDRPVLSMLQHSRDMLPIFTVNNSLDVVFKTMINARRHTGYIVDANDHLLGVFTLGDILSMFLLPEERRADRYAVPALDVPNETRSDLVGHDSASSSVNGPVELHSETPDIGVNDSEQLYV
ncbi:MAG: hypothetical protein MHM6MM_002453 [Cercozoa sp. M6MM]